MYPLTLQMQQCIKIFAHFASSNEQSSRSVSQHWQQHGQRILSVFRCVATTLIALSLFYGLFDLRLCGTRQSEPKTPIKTNKAESRNESTT